MCPLEMMRETRVVGFHLASPHLYSTRVFVEEKVISAVACHLKSYAQLTILLYCTCAKLASCLRCFFPLFFQELEVVTSVREALTNALSDAREQQRQNKEMKHQLEFDWSDKVFVFEKKIKLFGELWVYRFRLAVLRSPP